MKQPKALHLSMTGNGHRVNEDYALSNQELGIHVLCDGSNKLGKGNLAAEFVAREIQESLAKANRTLRENEVTVQGTKRLLKMQEMMLSAFADVGAKFLKVSEQNPNFQDSRVSCISIWLNDRFAILAHLGNCRAYLYRAGKVYTLTKDHLALTDLPESRPTDFKENPSPLAKVVSKSFGVSIASPDLLKIEFEPEDILFLATDGAYTSLQNSGLSKLVQSMLSGEDLKPILNQCAYASGDDATLVEIQFPKDTTVSAITASERIGLVSKAPMSRHMDYTQQSHMAALCQVEEFEPGSIIVQEGTEGESMYLVVKGTLEVLMKGQFIVYKKPGEFFGEVSLIQHGRRSATAVAKDRLTLLSLQRSDLREAFKKDIELERNFYKGMLEMVLERLVEQGREIAKMKSV